jgi:hypothetical protein
VSNTLNFVLASPNKAADHIDELERRLWLTVEADKQAAARIEALEAALRQIIEAGDFWEMDSIARAALAPEQDK